ncbi:DUF1465 family protein [Thalassospira sp. MA62]|nr:DUF1465 family protein [Thalassospira sp. MA62]
MANQSPPTSGVAPYQSNYAVVSFSRTYDEAFTLLVEARNYLSAHKGRKKAEGQDRALVQCVEEMRMTSRLIRAMAWLLSVRAVEAGEIDWQEAIDTDDLMVDLQTCIDEKHEEYNFLSPPLLDLMRRTHSLYMRAARMELQAAARCNA